MCSDNVTHRSCANLKCEVADVNKRIRIDLRGINYVSGECDQPYNNTFHNIFSPTAAGFELVSSCMLFSTLVIRIQAIYRIRYMLAIYTLLRFIVV